MAMGSGDCRRGAGWLPGSFRDGICGIGAADVSGSVVGGWDWRAPTNDAIGDARVANGRSGGRGPVGRALAAGDRLLDGGVDGGVAPGEAVALEYGGEHALAAEHVLRELPERHLESERRHGQQGGAS